MAGNAIPAILPSSIASRRSDHECESMANKLTAVEQTLGLARYFSVAIDIDVNRMENTNQGGVFMSSTRHGSPTPTRLRTQTRTRSC
mmetsp:Transcript_28773/g.32280  ORF Transcript_28773/g.32280 Transcript_28773/m.32280 type:complete len:87 (+) Transcript_28773:601-861(+)